MSITLSKEVYEAYITATQLMLEEGIASIIFEHEYEGGRRPGEEDAADMGRAILLYIVKNMTPPDVTRLRKRFE